HHRAPAFPADRPLRPEGTNRMKANRMKAVASSIGIVFLASIPLWLDNNYVLHILVITGIFIIAAISLNLLLGYAGQLSLGHVAFFGIGAYASSRSEETTPELSYHS